MFKSDGAHDSDKPKSKANKEKQETPCSVVMAHTTLTSLIAR